MAKNLNVNRSVNDPFYRYKMPRLIAKVEGKGNGIKTVVANMSEIAKALGRPATYPTKYFGCELGAQTNFDLKNDRYIVNGEHDASKLQDILDGFIKKFVLCPACDNPETVLTAKPKSQTIHGKCKACGHAFIIDPKQRLATFILKNPPPVEAGTEADSKEKHEGADGIDAADEGAGHAVNGSGPDSLDEQDDDWAPVESQPSEVLSGQIGKLVIDKDLDKTTEERLDMLHQYFVRAKTDGCIEDWKKMVNEAERLELKTKAPLLLADVLFDVDVVNQIKTYRPLLRHFCDDDKKAQRHLLGGIEQLVSKNKDRLLAKTAHIVKALYDNDICEEETLLSWGDKPSSKFEKKELVKEMIKVAEPVLKWLREAEETSDDEEGDESSEGVVKFDDRATVNGGAQINGVAGEAKRVSQTKAEETVKGNDGDEVNIDDI